jgi:hypothetical protein
VELGITGGVAAIDQNLVVPVFEKRRVTVLTGLLDGNDFELTASNNIGRRFFARRKRAFFAGRGSVEIPMTSAQRQNSEERRSKPQAVLFHKRLDFIMERENH